MRTLDFRAMNTAVTLAVADHGSAATDLEAARQFILDSERRFSRFVPDSEVSQLNQSAGSWRAASMELIDMLLQAVAYNLETGGLFDPSILPDLKRVGYDRSMDEIRRLGAGPLTSSVQPRVSLQKLEIDAASGWVRLPAGMEIDLGGIAKGWIVEKTVELLARSADACAVSAGGDILFKGYPAVDALWQVRIEDPWDPAREVTRLEVGPGAITTSSVIKRSWLQAGVPRHHLIDPRTGEPARGDWASVTVVAPQITVAEVYAKALLIGGEGALRHLLPRRPEISYIIVKSDRTVFSSFDLTEHLHEHESHILQ